MWFGGMGMGWGWLFGALVLVGLVLVVVVVIRAAGGGVTRAVGGPGDPGRGRARDILDERYARGEISTEEYQERLRTLGGSP